MPHLVLEASANIVESNERVRKILQECQELLTQQLPTQLASCKSRCVFRS
jgi:5-carboxymethyl-2-hydroxymuconate isomerase